ncbi:hypothetical protein [Photobacterium gaetbulicola]|uniref:hypothetical protein n=1 Tax=Photobacterium gaetbulicola TaxID=1295392 RepID=UPI0012E08815|nr:hypothetical protein [Photobacterium gaetbulicola]
MKKQLSLPFLAIILSLPVVYWLGNPDPAATVLVVLVIYILLHLASFVIALVGRKQR